MVSLHTVKYASIKYFIKVPIYRYSFGYSISEVMETKSIGIGNRLGLNIYLDYNYRDILFQTEEELILFKLSINNE